MYQKQ